MFTHVKNARFFVENASGAYGARIFLEVHQDSYHHDHMGILKSLSVWQGHDKRIESEDGALFFGFEMRQEQIDIASALLFKDGFKKIEP